MEKDILVTIIILTYNHEKYIKQALEGCLNQQTDFKYKIIIHDDASTDKTAEIIKEYQAKYPDIIKPIFQTENQYSKGNPISQKYIYPQIESKYVALCEGGSIKMNTLTDNSRAHIADMMLQGTVMGITALRKTASELPTDGDEEIVALLEEMLQTEEAFEKKWKEYL